MSLQAPIARTYKFEVMRTALRSREIGHGRPPLYYRARYYDQATGRFVSEDPLQFSTGPNFYVYIRNSPIDRVDPFGLDWLNNLADFSSGTGSVLSLVGGFIHLGVPMPLPSMAVAISTITSIRESKPGVQVRIMDFQPITATVSAVGPNLESVLYLLASKLLARG